MSHINIVDTTGNGQLNNAQERCFVDSCKNALDRGKPVD